VYKLQIYRTNLTTRRQSMRCKPLRLMTLRRVRRVRRVVWWFLGNIKGQVDDVVVLKLAQPVDCGWYGSRLLRGICYAVCHAY